MQQHGSKYFARRSHDPGGGVKRSKFNFYRTWVMLHIKLKGITNAATCKHIHVFCPYTHSRPLG